MKLVNVEYQLMIEFDENRMETLVVEHPVFLADIVGQLCDQFNGEIGGFILSEDEKALSFQKIADLIIDPFHIDLNNRRIINRLYAELGEAAGSAFVDYAEINAQTVRMIDDIISRSGYTGITYDLESGWEKIFQIHGVRLDDTFETLAEKMIEYIKIMKNLFGTKLFVFVGLHALLTKEQIEHVFRTAEYLKTQMLFIESSEYPPIDGERIRVIDKDRCLIEKATAG